MKSIARILAGTAMVGLLGIVASALRYHLAGYLADSGA